MLCRMILALSVSLVLAATGEAAQPRAATVPKLTAEQIYERFAGRVPVIRCFVRGEQVALASGIIFSPDGFVVTNAHVVEGIDRVEVTIRDVASGWKDTYEAELRHYDPEEDIAVLKVPVADLQFVQPAGPAGPPAVGTHVYALGNPLGLEGTLSEGMVSGLRDFGGSKVIQHSAAVSPGSSGGPVLDDQGRLVGMTSFLIEGGQSLNFAIPASRLALAVSRGRTSGALAFPRASAKPSSFDDVLAAFRSRVSGVN